VKEVADGMSAGHHLGRNAGPTLRLRLESKSVGVWATKVEALESSTVE
jgi:hypothetical protein